MRLLRVGFVIPTLEFGGGQKVAADLACQLVRHSAFHLTFLLYRDEVAYDLPSDVDKVVIGGVTGGSVWRRVANTFGNLLRLRTALRENEFDVVVSFMGQTNLMTLMACPKRIPLIITEHNVRTGWQNLSRESGPILAKATIFFLKRLLYPCATRIVAVSKGVAQDLYAHLGQKLNVEIIYNPIDIDRIQEMASKSLPTENFGKYIIGVGRLTTQKGFDLLIESFAKIPDKTIQLLLLGEGPQETALKELCLALGVQNRVHFLGFVNNPYVWMAHAQCFVLSSRWEGFGLVVAEALACGAPTVATDCIAGPSEILENGRYGLLVKPENPLALSQAICEVLGGKRFENPAAKLEEFRAERVANRYAQVISEAISGYQ